MTEHQPDEGADTPADPRREPRPLRMRHLVAACLVTALLGGTVTAYASHTFPDVPDSNPFHNQISWMAGTGITGGFGDGTFRPNDNVTRGQMAAFMQRLYNLQVGMFSAKEGAASTSISDPGGWTTLADASVTVTIPPGTQGRIVARFGGQSQCENTGAVSYIGLGSCRIRLRHGSTIMNPALNQQYFDSVSTPYPETDGPETHAIERFSGVLNPGTYTITVQATVSPSAGLCIPPCSPPTSATTFFLANWVLSAEVKLVDAPT